MELVREEPGLIVSRRRRAESGGEAADRGGRGAAEGRQRGQRGQRGLAGLAQLASLDLRVTAVDGVKLRFYLCLCEIRVRRAALERRPVVITSLALCGRHSSSSDDMEYEDYTSTSKVYDTTRVPIGLGSRFR